MAKIELDNYRDIKCLDFIPKEFYCQLCGCLMKEPIQTFRGNTACSHCYYQALEK